MSKRQPAKIRVIKDSVYIPPFA